MRVALAIALVATLVVNGTIRSQSPGDGPEASGRTLPTMAPASDQASSGGVDMNLVQEIAKQGILGLLLVVVLWSYRRDFFRRVHDRERQIQERKEEKEHLQHVLSQSTAAITNSAVAMARQTDATQRLEQTVDRLEQRVR